MSYQVGMTDSFSKTISESDIYTFAGISGDFNPVHVNSEYAKNSLFGKQIAHGFLSGSLISTVIGTKMPGPGTIYLKQNMIFKKPVYIGDTLEASVTIKDIKGSKAELDTLVTNQYGEIIIEGTALVKLPE